MSVRLGMTYKDLEGNPMPKNTPILAVGSALVMFVGVVVLAVSGKGGDNSGTLIVGFVLSTIPSLLAAAFAERAARDIRNGTVTEKSRQGTHKALQEAGVVTRSGPVANASLVALAEILKRLNVELPPEVEQEVAAHNENRIERDM